MKLASMKYFDGIGKSKQIKFGGLDHNPGAKDGTMWDMQNLTSSYYPLLASREKRRLCRKLEEPGGLFSWNGLCWVDGTGFYFEGVRRGTVTKGQKVFASMGPYIVIFPDKCWYNINTGEFGAMESKWSGNSLDIENGMLYGDTANANTIYCKGVDWSEWFNEGDCVFVSGCTHVEENNKSAIIREIDGGYLRFDSDVFTLLDEMEYTEKGVLTIERRVPDLLWVFENENRLWGCDGTTVFASKLDDIFNWYSRDGISSDGWDLTMRSTGYFTGGISYKGYSTFFKEEQKLPGYGKRNTGPCRGERKKPCHCR